MMDNDFLLKLKAALDSRKDYLARTELYKLREDFRAFQREISVLYVLFAKKGYIIEDPYKNETKVGDLKLPPTGNFTDMNKRDQLGMRLSMLDNELDYLVNFHEFSVDSFPQEVIKVMTGLVKYIDWVKLASPEANVTTQAVSEAIFGIRQGANDPIAYKTLADSLAILSGCTKTIMVALKSLSDFNREQYKYEIRIKITYSMNAEEATLPNIKKKFAGAKMKDPFYPDLAEEVIKEDYSKDSKLLQEAVLKRLAPAEEKNKPKKAPVSFKHILIDGLNVIGAAGQNLSEILGKLNENSGLLKNQNNGFLDMIKKFISMITNRDAEDIVYELEYTDPVKGATVHEKLNYKDFYMAAEKKITILDAIAVNGSAAKKLENMEERQLVELLQRNIKDVQSFHKILGVLDDYFKATADKANRPKIRGIKPELSALKNTVTKAYDRFKSYNAQKEEEAQFKRLGISPDGAG
jgi:hypothetical protein